MVAMASADPQVSLGVDSIPVESDRVLTCQGHSEFDRYMNSETLKYFATKLPWTPEMFASFLKDVDADDDAEIAADMIFTIYFRTEDRECEFDI
jgi:hypothetical protein